MVLFSHCGRGPYSVSSRIGKKGVTRLAVAHLFNSAEIFLVDEISSGGGGGMGRRHLWFENGQRRFGELVAGGREKQESRENCRIEEEKQESRDGNPRENPKSGEKRKVEGKSLEAPERAASIPRQRCQLRSCCRSSKSGERAKRNGAARAARTANAAESGALAARPSWSQLQAVAECNPPVRSGG